MERASSTCLTSLLLLLSCGALAGCDDPTMGMDGSASDASVSEAGTVNYRSQLGRAILYSHTDLSAYDRRSLCTGTCTTIVNANVRYACLGQCSAITDSDQRYLCQGVCAAISNVNLRNFCYGNAPGMNSCEQLPMQQDRALCNGPDAQDAGVIPGCELLTDVSERAFCQGNCQSIF